MLYPRLPSPVSRLSSAEANSLDFSRHFHLLSVLSGLLERKLGDRCPRPPSPVSRRLYVFAKRFTAV